jgi:hypothetical protein
LLSCIDSYSKRNVAEEAYQKAINDLKIEVRVAGGAAVWADNHATIDEIWITVQQVSCRIMYYGKVLDVLAQHHPEYVALAWGAMKLVLMVR